jgi:hypothetical protein
VAVLLCRRFWLALVGVLSFARISFLSVTLWWNDVVAIDTLLTLLRHVPMSKEFDFKRKDRKGMAEREGFEPSVSFTPHTISSRAPSAARTSLHLLDYTE